MCPKMFPIKRKPLDVSFESSDHGSFTMIDALVKNKYGNTKRAHLLCIDHSMGTVKRLPNIDVALGESSVFHVDNGGRVKITE